MVEDFLCRQDLDFALLQEVSHTTLKTIHRYTVHMTIGTDRRGTAVYCVWYGWLPEDVTSRHTASLYRLYETKVWPYTSKWRENEVHDGLRLKDNTISCEHSTGGINNYGGTLTSGKTRKTEESPWSSRNMPRILQENMEGDKIRPTRSNEQHVQRRDNIRPTALWNTSLPANKARPYENRRLQRPDTNKHRL